MAYSRLFDGSLFWCYNMAVVAKKGNNRRNTHSSQKALRCGGFYFAKKKGTPCKEVPDLEPKGLEPSTY